VQSVLPHDRLILTTLSSDGRELIIEASSGEPAPEMPAHFRASVPGQGDELPEYILIADIDDQTEECGAKDGCLRMGMRSFLGIPMHLDSGTAWLMIVSRTPSQYSEEDVVVGRRVADHISRGSARACHEPRRARSGAEGSARNIPRVPAGDR
jgi:hypothetical protein